MESTWTTYRVTLRARAAAITGMTSLISCFITEPKSPNRVLTASNCRPMVPTPSEALPDTRPKVTRTGPSMATTASAPAPTTVIWVGPAAWDSVPNVNKARYDRNAAKRPLVPDRGYDVYLKQFSTFTSSYLHQQLGETLKANVEEAAVCANYVRVLKYSVLLCKERDEELERNRALDYDTPSAKRACPVEPASEP